LSRSLRETAVHLFDTWLTIETGLRGSGSGIHHAMIEGELDLALSPAALRSSYEAAEW